MPFDGQNHPFAPTTPKIAAYPGDPAIGLAFHNILTQSFYYSRSRRLISYQPYRHWFRHESTYQTSNTGNASIDPGGSFVAQTTNVDLLTAYADIPAHITHLVGVLGFKSFHASEATFELELACTDTSPSTQTNKEVTQLPRAEPSDPGQTAQIQVLERDFSLATVELDVSSVNDDDCYVVMRGFCLTVRGTAQYFRPFAGAVFTETRG